MAIKNLPNILTLSRIAIIPLVVAAFYLDGKFAHQLAAVLFLIAGITDFFDGYLARAWSAQSSLGKFLDPIADKLLVAAALIMLVDANRAPVLPSLLIVSREILVSGLREFLAEIKVSVPVSRLAKIKTAAQMTAIFLLLLGAEGSGMMAAYWLGSALLWLAAGLTILTGYAYLKASIRYFN